MTVLLLNPSKSEWVVQAGSARRVKPVKQSLFAMALAFGVSGWLVPMLAQTPTNPLARPPVVAAPSVDPAGPVALDVKSTLAAATASLRKINTATGRFSQIAPDGSVTVGTFHLRRPGRMRFAYDAPTPILIVADGSTVAVEDKALETIDRVPLSTTPLGLFLKKDPDLARDADVVSVQGLNGQVFIRLRDKSGETEGDLIMVFSEKNFALQEWMVIDAQNGLTRTTLSSVTLNRRLDPRLFILRDKAR
jgi:outer membrane lipoprotein-sorting protein